MPTWGSSALLNSYGMLCTSLFLHHALCTLPCFSTSTSFQFLQSMSPLLKRKKVPARGIFWWKQSAHYPCLRKVYWEALSDYSPLLNSLRTIFSLLTHNAADAPMDIAAAIEALLPASAPPSTVFPEVEVFIFKFEHYLMKFQSIKK